MLLKSGWISDRRANPKHIPWALYFMKWVYSTEENNTASVGGVDEKTFRKNAWFYVKSNAELVFDVVS
jgi:hypothetical protein